MYTWKQQGYVFANSTTHYLCQDDILAPGPPPKQNYSCADTPYKQCMTGCPASPGNTCGGGHAPPGSCNHCECNVQNTTCPTPNWRTGHPCLPGWYPDPLLDVPATGIPLVPSGFTQPVMIELCIPYGTIAGNYSGSVTLTSSTAAGDDAPPPSAVTIPVSLEVWPIDLPRLNDTDAFNTAFRFGSDMSAWYPPNTPPQQMWDDWLPFLAHHRVPGDDIYLPAPRSTAEYETLANTGAKWMGLMDAGIRPPVPAGYVDTVLATLKPVVENLTTLGYGDKIYVYGFDEMPESDNQSVYEIFGAIKKQWPQVTTMAVLDCT